MCCAAGRQRREGRVTLRDKEAIRRVFGTTGRTLSRAVWPGVPLWFALLSLAALILRVALVFQYSRSPFCREPLGDERYYWLWAGEIASGRWWPQGVFYQAPLYPYLLAVVKGFAPGFGPLGLAAVQVTLNWLTCLLLVPPVTSWAGRGRALVAASLALFFAPAVFYSLKGLPTAFGLFLLVGALALLCGAKGPSGRRAAAGGCLTGLALLASPGFLPVAPGVVLVAALAAARKKRIAAVLLVTLGAALVILPVTALNYRQDGSFVLISSSYGVVFALGNNERAQGSYASLAGIATVAGQEILDAERIATREAGRGLRQDEVSRFFFRRGLGFVFGKPGRWLALELRKAALLLSGLDVPHEFSLARERRDFLSLLWAFPVGGTAAVLVALLALAWPELRAGAWRPLILAALLGGSCLVFFVSGRHAFPAYFMALAAAPAGLGAFSPKGRWGRTLAPVLVVGVSLTVAVPFLADTAWEGDDYLLKLAGVYERQGRTQDALATYERWWRLAPSSPLLFAKIAEFYLRNGQPDDAEGYILQSLAIDPDNRTTRWISAQILIATDRAAAAAAVLEELLAVDELDTKARLLLATTYEQTGRKQEAREALEQAARLDPFSKTARQRLEALGRR